MKRRDLIASVFVAGLATPVLGDNRRNDHDRDREHDHSHGHGHHDDDGKLRNHTVSFGHWNPVPGTTPLDRFAPNDPNPRTLNGHALIPSPVKVHVGDTVSFIISGFHNVQIFGPGTQPANIDRTKLLLAAGFPPIIDDANHRVYRGNDPRVNPANQDRVESVGFNQCGRYLVICGVLPHFFDDASGQFVMFGYVDVDED
jgi:plastocyanin